MNMTNLRKLASQQGIKGANFMKKTDLIRAIQTAECNFPCFATAAGGCDQQACAWREDCLVDNDSARA